MLLKESSQSSQINIPVESPSAALSFCQALAQLMKSQTLAAENIESPTISVVVPVYNEEANVVAMKDRLLAVLGGLGESFEIIFVDDGSSETTKAALAEVSKHPCVGVVELSRNFGHQAALSAGLEAARGSAVMLLDCDLQDPPEMIPEFISKWREGAEVVYAIRDSRKEGIVLRICYSAYYRILRALANIDIPLDSGDFCLLDRKVVDVLCKMSETNRFLRGMRTWVGLNQIGLKVERNTRIGGRPKYTWRKLFHLAGAGLFSFSYVPLRVITVLGAIISFGAVVLAGVYAFIKFTKGMTPPGFATTVTLICFFAGIQLLTTGLIGEYVGRIFEEVKKRPLYVVRRLYGRLSG